MPVAPWKHQPKQTKNNRNKKRNSTLGEIKAADQIGFIYLLYF